IFLICLDDLFEKEGLVLLPPGAGENLDFVEALVSGGFHPSAYFFYGYAAVAHQCTVEQQIFGGHAPVANVKGEEVAIPAAPGDLLLEVRVPPKVVDVHRHAHLRGVQFNGHVVGLGQRVDGGAGVGVHGVERLDGELDAGGDCVGNDGGDAIVDLLTRYF